MVNLDPNSSSVGLGDLTQQFDDILGGTDTNRSNRSADSDRVHPEQTRLPSIIGEDNNVDNPNSDTIISDLSRNTHDVAFGDGTAGNGGNLIGNIHQVHVNDRSSNSVPSIHTTGEPSLSRHQEQILQQNVHSSTRASSGLEIRVSTYCFSIFT